MLAGAYVGIYCFEEKLGVGESVTVPLGVAYVTEMTSYFALFLSRFHFNSSK